MNRVVNITIFIFSIFLIVVLLILSELKNIMNKIDYKFYPTGLSLHSLSIKNLFGSGQTSFDIDIMTIIKNKTIFFVKIDSFDIDIFYGRQKMINVKCEKSMWIAPGTKEITIKSKIFLNEETLNLISAYMSGGTKFELIYSGNAEIFGKKYPVEGTYLYEKGI